MIGPSLLASAAIFHGTPVPPEQAPWLVTLTRASVVCGGTLIAPDRVLTAAHCVQGANPGKLSVRLGGRRHA
jgi:secreted trypsin-like serine protease